MNPRAWFLAFRDAVLSMTQSSLMSLASMATVAVSLLVLSVVLLLAVNMEHWATTVEQQVEIKAYICAAWDEPPACNKQELSEEQRRTLLDQVSKIPGIKSYKFVTRQQALEQMKKDFAEQKDILDGLEGENPLSDMVEIKVHDPNAAKSVAEAISKLPGIRKVNWGEEWVGKLVALTNAIRVGGVALVLMLVVATILTISNTIRLAVYARRREIAIMKLVGATDWYIRRPFMIEGIILGFFGAVLAMLATGYGYDSVVQYLYKMVPFLPLIPSQDVLMSMTLGLVLLGSVLGAVGSLISMRRFLKV